ncbi:transcriptional regulator, MarR family [Caldicellulosiruptor hydrothermalis 108]|uniref:Transcriptional regulator, MarR family n=1 Tax=Caldicellulosiruptor hydrothermalis (strain DSM 18901 / VKM B-2411 / 108) TaxID=632292 RepID=E4Q975_CALH1|nr:MarR family transcriptional regulator [Caldicellulosiruptor hydrothermalis]ADQ08124.1 transcriptional regulator, MarR family [Caldicellulosiruptor hydrothermalis 108]
MELREKKIRLLRLLKEVSIKIREALKYRGDEVEIPASHWMMMSILDKNGKMKVGDLSSILGLSNSTVSGILDRLEKQGFVERERSTEDRRVVWVQTTQKFKECLYMHFKEAEKQFENLLSKATEDEIDKVLEGFETLKRILER